MSPLSCPGLSVFVFLNPLPPLSAKEEHRTAFFGEDVHISIPSLSSTEVVFKSRVIGQPEVVLMQNGAMVQNRTKLNIQFSNLILEDVGEEDEGLYVVKNTNDPTHVRQIKLIVRGTKRSI